MCCCLCVLLWETPCTTNRHTDQGLDLSLNAFMSGTIPSEIGMLTNLEELSLQALLFVTGSIPSEVGKLSQLEMLNLQGCALTGTLSSEIGRLINLEWAFLSVNELSGPLPSEIGLLTNLELITVALNDLTGTIPSVYGRLTDVFSFDLSGNEALSGTIPSELGQLVELVGLRLESTDLTGSVPEEVCRLREEERLSTLTIDCEEVACSCCTDLCFTARPTTTSAPSPATSFEPTFAPSASPMPSHTPSIAPTFEVSINCEAGFSAFSLLLVTDQLARETSWDLVDDSGQILQQGGPYAVNEEQFIEETCVASGECATFTIRDGGGDGICCGVFGEGSYTVFLNGEELASGGAFGSSESFRFGDCSPTSFPSSAPTSSPSVSEIPTSSPMPTTQPWIQLGEDVNGDKIEQLGTDVALSGNGTILGVSSTSIVGQYVRVLQYLSDADVWEQLGEDIEHDGGSDDFFGFSISLSHDGTFLAVGAPLNDYGGADSGLVRVYQYSDQWTQIGQDLIGEAGGATGVSVMLSNDGMVLATGASTTDGNTGNDGDDRGRVQVFQYNPTTNWTRRGQELDGEGIGDISGSYLSLSDDGSILAICARRNDNPNGVDAGHVRVYRFNDTTSLWLQLGQDIDGQTAGELFGTSVAFSSDGMIVASGAVASDNNRGRVRVYAFDTAENWTQVGQDIEGDRAGDFFGRIVRLSSDGNVIAIGAPGELFSDVDDRTGYVRVYQYDTVANQWDIILQQDGEDLGDEFGAALSLSSDGSILAVGAPQHNFAADAGAGSFNGLSAGSVSVFQQP